MIDIKTHGIGAGGKGSGMNVFCQPTEPANKEGIWIQSPTTSPVKKVVIDDSPFTAGDYDLSMRPTMLGALNYSVQWHRPIIYNKKIYIFGGFDNGNNYSNKLYSYDTVTNAWTLLMTYSSNPLMGYSVGAYNNKLYFLAGATNNSSTTGFCHVYDIATNTMTSLQSAVPNALKGVAFYYSEEHKSIYYYGGYNSSNNYVGQGGRYDMSTGGNALFPNSIFNSSTNTKGACIGVVNSKMYIIGGVNVTSGNGVTTTKVINLSTNAFDADVAMIPINVYEAHATVYKNEIYVFGGRIMGVGWDSSLVQIYNPATNTWRNGKSAPMPFSDVNPTVENGCAWIITGYATLKYDFATDEWEKFFSQKTCMYGLKTAVVGNNIIIPCLYGSGGGEGLMYDYVENVGEIIPPMPTRNNNYALVAHCGKVYCTAFGNQMLYSFDPIGKTWATLAPILQNTSGGSLVGIGGFLYYMGGATSNFTGFMKYDIALNKWTAMEVPLAFPDKYNSYFCVYNDSIYCFHNNLETASTVVYKYDFSQKTWVTYSTISNYRSIYKGGVVVGSKAYLFGGGDPSNNNSMKKLAIFDFNSRTFEYGKDLPTPRMNMGVCLAGDEIYVTGGQVVYSGTPYSASADIYSLVSKKYNESDIVIKKTSNYYGDYSAVLYDNKNISGTYNRLLTTFDDAYLYKNNNLNTYPAYYGDGTKWIKFK